MKFFKSLVGFLEVVAVLCLNAQWTKIFVEKSIIDSRNWLYESIENYDHSVHDLAVIQFLASVEHSEVFLACFLTDTQLLLHGSMFNPLYKNQIQDTYTCYTKMNRDLVFGSSITGMGAYHPATLGRTEQNLMDGHFNGNHDFCLQFDSLQNPKWILINFGQLNTFTTVSITILTYNFYLLKAGHIWISNSTSVNGDFSIYKHFGSFPDFTSGQTLNIKNHFGQSCTAQYVGIEQTEGSSMTICHLTIY